ncbi:Hpt domain-containing protein [Arthrobacter bussei]|uniref:Hpt domain-containing protein n=1 Tax=Arthrobacter bussei TaxID=2594179 RepID=UPI001782D535
MFEELIDQLDSRATATDFLDSFAAMLTDRIRVIEDALRAHHHEDAVRALHSLRASAVMVGARQLEASTTRALDLSNPESTAVGPLVRKLQGQADLFRTAIIPFRTPAESPSNASEVRQHA